MIVLTAAVTERSMSMVCGRVAREVLQESDAVFFLSETGLDSRL